MKFFICFALVAIVAVSALTEEQKEKVRKVSKECREQNGITEEDVTKIRNGDFSDPNPKIKAHVLCFSKKVGLAKEDGEPDVEVIKTKLHKVVSDHAKADEIIKECIVKHDTPEESAYENFKCLYKHKAVIHI